MSFLIALGAFISGVWVGRQYVLPRGLKVTKNHTIKFEAPGKYTVQLSPVDEHGFMHIVCAEKIREPMHRPKPKGEHRGGA